MRRNDGIRVRTCSINLKRLRRLEGKKVAGPPLKRPQLGCGACKSRCKWMSNNFCAPSTSRTNKAWKYWLVLNSRQIWWSSTRSAIIRALLPPTWMVAGTGHRLGARQICRFWTMQRSWGCRRCRTWRPIWTGYRVSSSRKRKWLPACRASWRRLTRGFRGLSISRSWPTVAKRRWHLPLSGRRPALSKGNELNSQEAIEQAPPEGEVVAKAVLNFRTLQTWLSSFGRRRLSANNWKRRSKVTSQPSKNSPKGTNSTNVNKRQKRW